MAEKKEFLKGKKPITFVDLFAGAGGISEGFLQAYTDHNYFDFVLASDINENCELTHRVRYNEQLGLKTKFLTEDIMSPTFLPNLTRALGGKDVDVVTGGPSCQSFSLSGRRKRFDKRDGLFNHYLKVIRTLRPKYFVMENVKGLLTKDHGRFKVEIMREMRSIIDDQCVEAFYKITKDILAKSSSAFLLEAFMLKLKIEIAKEEKAANDYKEEYFNLLDNQLRAITKNLDYKTSKSDVNISTIRHGLYLLRRNEERDKITSEIINLKTVSNIDNDLFADDLNNFLSVISDEEIIKKIIASIDNVEDFKNASNQTEELKYAIKLYSFSLDECFDEIGQKATGVGLENKYKETLKHLRLYNVEQMVLLSSDYGVPQNRERVVFIGSRKDQKTITKIPASVINEDKVTTFEAISDLDFIGNGEIRTKYDTPKRYPELENLIKRRRVDGVISDESGSMTFAEWSKMGRLSHRFNFECNPFYVKDMKELNSGKPRKTEALFNHQTSSQNDTVKRRLELIAKFGGYTDECKIELEKAGLESNKRNYFVLRANAPSPTVVTMPDDFIHYGSFRAMTVREMARLQSFDDSFVFQGKRSTGGDKRKVEIPQYTLVGNAVPPLMSRAIGNEILKNIE